MGEQVRLAVHDGIDTARRAPAVTPVPVEPAAGER